MKGAALLFCALCMLMPYLLQAQSLDSDSDPTNVSDGSSDRSRPDRTPDPSERKQKKEPFPVLSSVGRRDESAARLFQERARSDYLLALELKDRGRYAEALRRFQDFRTLYPAHPETPLILLHIVEIYERMSAPEKALHELWRYLDRQSGQPAANLLPLYSRRAELEYLLGHWGKAMISYRQLIRLFPADPVVAKARLRLQEMQSALESSSETPSLSQQEPSLKESVSEESSLDRLGEGLDIEN
jgi:tetratricopeptide (TPR) repeat protein